jgi:hypothetical protein
LRAYLAAEVQAGRAREVKSFFSVNALGVTSTAATLQRLAAFAGVERIILAPVVSIPAVTPGVEEATVNEVEWNIAQARAPKVWGQGH